MFNQNGVQLSGAQTAGAQLFSRPDGVQQRIYQQQRKCQREGREGQFHLFHLCKTTLAINKHGVLICVCVGASIAVVIGKHQ